MEHDEVYGRFVLTVYVFESVPISYFCKKFAYCKKTDSASLFTVGIIKNVILSWKLKMKRRANCFHEYL